jgi:N-carbamoylputrescine amidase
MTKQEIRTVRIAAVQMESQNGDIPGNLKRAAGLVEQAARKEAKLILLPEFLPTGYIFTKDIWGAAEPKEGPTVQWLGESSRRLSVWLGTSFLEAEGDDFYNTFVMTGPDGEEAGRVRKQTPAAFEAYFFKGQRGPHVIETEFGLVGVGICYENQLSYMVPMLQEQSVDLVLMPHSAPTPMQTFYFPRRLVELYNRDLGEAAARTASVLGVPAVMVNKSGPWRSPLPLPLPTQRSSFPGLSTIADSDGTVKAQLGDEEGVIIEEVTLDPSRKTHQPPPCFGRWAARGPLLRNVVWPAAEFIGRQWYSMSSERKRRAREVSAREVRTYDS